VARGRRSDVESASFTLTLDLLHLTLLDRVVRTGFHGRSRSDAASAILRQWLVANVAQVEAQYRELGVLPPTEKPS